MPYALFLRVRTIASNTMTPITKPIPRPMYPFPRTLATSDMNVLDCAVETVIEPAVGCEIGGT